MEINDTIRKQMGSWNDLFAPFIQSEKWDKIFGTLKQQSQAKKIIIPASIDVFKSFELLDRTKLKAIFVLMDPYPSFKEGKMIASGIPMSCSITKELQPSLYNFYQSIEDSYFKFDPDMDWRADNSYLLTEEHVLLLNTSLTVEKDKVGSHSQLWMPFMQFFIEGIINKYYTGLPIILCGNSAQKLEKYISPMLHYILKVEHPVAGQYAGNRAWEYKDCFEWCNRIIESNNGPEHKIRWWRKKGEDNYSDLPDWVTNTKTSSNLSKTPTDSELTKDMPF